MPTKASEREGRLATMSVRVTQDSRARLEKAASENGRSLAQEVEMRLAETFQKDDLLSAMFGENSHSQNVVRAISTAIRRIELVTDKRWVSDYMTLWACRRAVEKVLSVTFGYATSLPSPPNAGDDPVEFHRRLALLADDAATETCRDLGLIVAGPSRGELQMIPTQVFEKAKPKSASEG